MASTNVVTMLNRRELISAIVDSEARRPTSWSQVDAPKESLLGQVLTLLTSQARAGVEIISVDDSYLEMASYSDLTPPIVLLGIGHLRRLYAFLDLFELELPNKEAAIELSKQAVLESLADCFLLGGNEELAVRSFVLSILGTSSFFTPSTDPFDNIFGEQVSLKDFIFQYYGLAHEIGHCVQPRFPFDRAWIDQEMEALPLEHLAQARKHPEYDDVRARVVIEKMQEYARSSVNRKHVEEEISADVFAVINLFNMGITGWYEDYGNPVSFINDFTQNLYFCMNGVGVSERLQQFARLVAQNSGPAHLGGDEWLAYQFTHRGTQLRIKAVLDILARLISSWAGRTGDTLITASDWLQLLLKTIEAHNSRVNSLDEGLTSARHILFGVRDDTLDLIPRMVNYHKSEERLSWVTEFFIERVRERIPSAGRYVDPLAATLYP